MVSAVGTGTGVRFCGVSHRDPPRGKISTHSIHDPFRPVFVSPHLRESLEVPGFLQFPTLFVGHFGDAIYRTACWTGRGSRLPCFCSRSPTLQPSNPATCLVLPSDRLVGEDTTTSPDQARLPARSPRAVCPSLCCRHPTCYAQFSGQSSRLWLPVPSKVITCNHLVATTAVRFQARES
jgi:hypothetical protein